MNGLTWYLSRATGIVATVLAVAALAGGFLFSARQTGNGVGQHGGSTCTTGSGGWR